MSVQTDYSFQGIGFIESQERINEARTGVPAMGAPALLQRAPIKRLSKVRAVNAGKEAAYLRLKHGGMVETQTNENVTAFNQGSQVYVGALEYKNIVPGSVSITNGGSPATIVDDSNGNLVDTGTTTKRGTINYTTGAVSWTYGAAETQPVRASYQHNDYIEFATATQTTTKAAASYPFVVTTGYGRVAPGTISISESGGGITYIDDGKGNIIQNDSAGHTSKQGSVDYATGIITITGDSASANLSGTVTVTYKFNPFAALVVQGAASKLMDLFGEIPELTNVPYAAGIKGETYIGLFGDGHVSGGQGTNLVTFWSHYSEEPWRVDDVFSSFPVGGQSNDPSISQTVDHL